MTSSFDTTPGKLQINLTGDLIGGADAMKFSVDLRESLAAFAKNPLLFKEGAGGGHPSFPLIQLGDVLQ